MPAAGFALARGAISPSRARCPCHAACGMAILAMKERGQDARSRFCAGPRGHLSFTGKRSCERITFGIEGWSFGDGF